MYLKFPLKKPQYSSQHLNPGLSLLHFGLKVTLDILSFSSPTALTLNLAYKCFLSFGSLILSDEPLVDALMYGVDAYALYYCVTNAAEMASPGLTFFAISLVISIFGTSYQNVSSAAAYR